MIREGERFRIEAIDLSDERPEGGCPARDFLAKLVGPPQKRLTGLLARHANGGPLLNEQQSREIKDGIYEFKTIQGARLLYFYPGTQRLTILTHGFMKGAKLPAEVARAKRYRERYLAAFPIG